MAEPNEKKNPESKLTKCQRCQNYNENTDSCSINENIKACSKSNFSKCQDFLWHERFTMF